MKPYEAVGYMMINATAITSIVGSGSAANVYHGLRPRSTDLPSVNYYAVGGGSRYNGMERQQFSINCRAGSASQARDLARVVMDVFAGTEGRGVYGTANTFEVGRSSLANDDGLIPEPDDRTFNAPIEVTLVYPVSTVS